MCLFNSFYNHQYDTLNDNVVNIKAPKSSLFFFFFLNVKYTIQIILHTLVCFASLEKYTYEENGTQRESHMKFVCIYILLSDTIHYPKKEGKKEKSQKYFKPIYQIKCSPKEQMK